MKGANKPPDMHLGRLMNSTKETVLNVSVHASDPSLLPVSADLIWLIELLEQWSWSNGVRAQDEKRREITAGCYSGC